MAEWIIEVKDGKFPIGKWTKLVRCEDCKHLSELRSKNGRSVEMIEHTDLDGGDRLISKDAFFRILQREYLDKDVDEVGQDVYNNIVHVNMLLYAMPFADAKYVRHGQWKVLASGNDAICTNCEHYWIPNGDQYDYHYCPNCGAKMDEMEVRWQNE